MAWSGDRHSFNEFARKKLVYLKRNTKIIPFICIIITCMIFSFRLSAHSQSAIRCIDGVASLYIFVIMLASIMSIIAFIGFKRFTLKGMIPFFITILILGLQLGLQFAYINIVNKEIANIVNLEESLAYPYFIDSIAKAKEHIVFLCISIFLIAMLPLLIKLFNRIKTSLPDQFEQTEEIDIILEDIDE